jgi:hypothetical protein
VATAKCSSETSEAYVAPDFSRYIIKSVEAGEKGSSIHRDDLKFAKRLNPGILEGLGIQVNVQR